MLEDSRYVEYFQPELNAMDEQSKKNNELYDEVHKAMEKNIERLDGKAMFGSSSPHKDIAAIGEVLNSIRSNQVSIIKEKANIKKTIIDLDIRKENAKSQTSNAEVNQTLMQDLLNEFNRKLPNANRPSTTELKDNRGREKLGEIDPDTLCLNENDFKMIDRFVGKGK